MAVAVDALIFGGGVAGLWTLDALVRGGRSAVLVECDALGAGQTVWSQGILHGGVKYSLKGMLSPSARAVRDMPAVWRACLAGEAEPDLSGVAVRSECCWLWQTGDLSSRLGMLGARIGLRAGAEVVGAGERPGPLRDCPGAVARVDEQVIDAASLVRVLGERHTARIVRIGRDDVGFERRAGEGWCVMLRAGGASARLLPGRIVLLAGGGNDGLREKLGLAGGVSQVRPLRMVMARGRRGGSLPELYGHCVDGAHTRVTITSARDGAGRVVWQVGGAVADAGVSMAVGDAIAHAKAELGEVLPGVDLSAAEWAAYDAPRAEGRTAGGGLPEGPVVLGDGAVVTGWPSKLVLGPRLAEDVVTRVPGGGDGAAVDAIDAALAGFDRPAVAGAPWESDVAAWTSS